MNVKPEVFTVKRYRCPFCRRTHSSSTRATVHINRCWYNPATRCCKTCANFVPDQSEPDVGYVSREYCDAGSTSPATSLPTMRQPPARRLPALCGQLRQDGAA